MIAWNKLLKVQKFFCCGLITSPIITSDTAWRLDVLDFCFGGVFLKFCFCVYTLYVVVLYCVCCCFVCTLLFLRLKHQYFSCLGEKNNFG